MDSDYISMSYLLAGTWQSKERHTDVNVTSSRRTGVNVTSLRHTDVNVTSSRRTDVGVVIL